MMRKNNLKGIALASVVAGGMLMNSCDLVKDIEYTVKQNPLEMHGDKVNLEINGKFIEKGLHKKAIVEVTPTFVCKDGTEIPFDTKIFQGYKAAGNGEVIPKEGKAFSYTSTVPYNGSMEEGDLVVKVLPKKGTKTKDLITTDKIADGTIITPLLVQFDDKVIFSKDNFVRTTEETTAATINYAKGKFDVKGAELKQEDIVAFEAFATEASTNPKREMKSINIMSYASPEGEVDKNANLASDRAGSAATYTNKLMTKINFAAGQQAGFVSQTPKGEDWDGFKAEVSKTSHEDKELILRVLEMTSDPVKREEDIRNMAKTYSFLEKEVLPQLRRSTMTLTYDKIGYSDEELKQLSKTNPDILNVEELLFTAGLYEDLNEKLRVYKETERLFGNDYRAANNVGYVLYLQNDIDGAAAKFEKANGLESNATTLNNLGAIAHVKGDKAAAVEYFGQAGSSPEVNYNKGIVAIQDGNYADAISNMGDNKTLNVALAKILNGEADAAMAIIDASSDADAALAYYLKAIVGARTSNKDLMLNNLKSAIAKDASLKEKAKKDREFIKYMDAVTAL
jgi:tetratricopeptide (TPR) repeat protein